MKVVIVASLLALGGSTVLPVVQQVKADSVDSEVTTLNVKESREAMKVNLEESKVPVRLANSSIGAGGGSAVGGIGAGIAAGIAGLGSIHLKSILKIKENQLMISILSHVLVEKAKRKRIVKNGMESTQDIIRKNLIN